MHGDFTLPDWLERGVESSLRDTEDDAPPPPPIMAFSSSTPLPQRPKGFASPVVSTPASGSASPSGGAKGQWADLDKFYEDEEDEEQDDGSDEEDEEASTEEGSDDEEEESDGEEPHGHT